jgi:hypothetical protein
MLGEAFVGPPAPTSTPGMNTTKRLALVGGDVVFHKPFSGVQVANAIAFGQTGETPPLHEAASWRRRWWTGRGSCSRGARSCTRASSENAVLWFVRRDSIITQEVNLIVLNLIVRY